MEWTEEKDRFLVFYGRCLEGALGSRAAAMRTMSRNDFPGLTPEELSARLNHLKRTRSDWCGALEREADTDYDGDPSIH